MYAAGLTVAIASACASPSPVAGPAPEPSTVALPMTGPLRWSGTLQPVQQRTGMAAPTSQNKAYGTVFLAAAGPERTRVRVTVSTPITSAAGGNPSSLAWGIHPGRCGSGSLPLVGIERFPPIELTGAGRGELDAEMAFRLPESGSYHVNVFWGRRSGLQDVMTCANLRRETT